MATGSIRSRSKAQSRSSSTSRATSCRAPRAGRPRRSSTAAAPTAGLRSNSHELIDGLDIDRILRPPRSQLVRAQLGKPDDGDVANVGAHGHTTTPHLRKRHARDAGQDVDLKWGPAEHLHSIRFHEPAPRSSEVCESELAQRLTELARVCLARSDQDVEVLGRARTTVCCDRVRSDDHEPDAMALQSAEKLEPFGWEL